MKTPVLIIIIASVVVLCTLPAIYIFLAYHTYRERQRWKVEHDMALDKMEAERQRNPRAASAASHSIYSSLAPGKAPSVQHYHQRQSPAPSRPAPVHNPRWAPPRPPRELDVFKSSRDHLSSQADGAPPSAPQGSGRSINRPAPGSTTTRRNSGAGGSSKSSGKQKQKQQKQQQQVQEQARPSSSVYGATSDETSQGTWPLPPTSSRLPPASSRLPPASQLPPASRF